MGGAPKEEGRLIMIHSYFTANAEGTEVTEHGVGIKAYDEAKAEADERGLFVMEAKHELVDTSMVYDGTVDLTEWRDTWERLSRDGACDGIDGAEYTRVTDFWRESDQAEVMEDFIRREANRGPGG